MPRCGCSSDCSCSVVAGDGVTIEGNGQPGTPYVVSVGGDACGPIMDCVCDAADAGMGVDCTASTLSVLPSTDAGNVIVTGSDGRLYAGDTPGPPPPTPIVQSDTVGVPLTGSPARGSINVTFPQPFSTPPDVVATVAHDQGVGGNPAIYAIRIANVTATGCTLFLLRVDSATALTATIDTSWMAHGLPAAP